MAEQFDVTARLAEGRPTVDDVEEYVAACRRLGYQHRDLTAHPTQVRDWYDGDDGMNLSVLDADHSALSAAALAAEEAARTQADLVAELTTAWAGRGAAAADEFLWRSGQAAQSVSTAVRRAADGVAALRDALWRAVDAKVAATEAVAGSQAPHRDEWLAAARTVTNGGADVDSASELVHERVVPFVDLDVGSDWVSAMRAATASIDAAHDAAVVALAAAPRAVFEVPGDVGPPVPPVPAGRQGDVGPTPGPPIPAGPPDEGGPVSTAPVAQTIPTAAVAPAASIPAAAVATPAPAASWADPLPAVAPAPPAPPLGDLGTGAQGSGLPGFGQQLADLLGGLIGSAGGGSPEDLALDDDPVDGEPVEGDEDSDEEEGDKEEGDEGDSGEEDSSEEDSGEEDGDEEDDDADEPDAGEGDPADCGEGDPPATAPPDANPQPASDAPPEPAPLAAPTAEPAPPPAAADGEPTPCEKAADAVPQVGE